MAGLAWSAPVSCVARSMRGTRAAQRADTHRMRGALRHQHLNATLFAVLLCLPTAPGLPLQGNGDFGTSPLLLGSSRTSQGLPVFR
jgi:hypothetical protein